jgi:hypothetical protein
MWHRRHTRLCLGKRGADGSILNRNQEGADLSDGLVEHGQHLARLKIQLILEVCDALVLQTHAEHNRRLHDAQVLWQLFGEHQARNHRQQVHDGMVINQRARVRLETLDIIGRKVEIQLLFAQHYHHHHRDDANQPTMTQNHTSNLRLFSGLHTLRACLRIATWIAQCNAQRQRRLKGAEFITEQCQKSATEICIDTMLNVRIASAGDRQVLVINNIPNENCINQSGVISSVLRVLSMIQLCSPVISFYNSETVSKGAGDASTSYQYDNHNHNHNSNNNHPTGVWRKYNGVNLARFQKLNNCNVTPKLVPR